MAKLKPKVAYTAKSGKPTTRTVQFPRRKQVGFTRENIASNPHIPAEFDAIDYSKSGDSIGILYETPLEAVKLVKSGLSFSTVERLRRTSGLTRERIKQITRISEGSFARRKTSGRLSLEESEGVLRLSRVFERATSLYDGDQNGAVQWLETPIPALDNQRPLDLAQTEPGAREVENLIGRIEHGIVS
jgi:putative toxin-antitoxin system antitoxin component (TIGR02293 family)